jgi:hypothetical protein
MQYIAAAKLWRRGEIGESVMNDKKSFEATYVAYPFPALVDFGMALSRLFVRSRHWRDEAANVNTPASKDLREAV